MPTSGQEKTGGQEKADKAVEDKDVADKAVADKAVEKQPQPPNAAQPSGKADAPNSSIAKMDHNREKRPPLVGAAGVLVAGGVNGAGGVMGRQPSLAVDSDGSVLKDARMCPHGRRKTLCKECGGKGICQHNRRRSACKDCGVVTMCEHGCQKSRCKDCKGASICEHNRDKKRCKDCKILAAKPARNPETTFCWWSFPPDAYVGVSNINPFENVSSGLAYNPFDIVHAAKLPKQAAPAIVVSQLAGASTVEESRKRDSSGCPVPTAQSAQHPTTATKRTTSDEQAARYNAILSQLPVPSDNTAKPGT